MPLTLQLKFYGKNRNEAVEELEKRLEKAASGIEASFRIEISKMGWPEVELTGDDAQVFTRYLEQKLGKVKTSLGELREGEALRGWTVNSGRFGFGLFVDIGISKPKSIDALIPLHALRRQLVGDEKRPLSEIASRFCLYDNFPLEVNTVRINLEMQTVEAALSERQVTVLNDWKKSSRDRIIVLGAPHGKVEQALRKAGVFGTKVELENLGVLENSIRCRSGTDAPGIVALIGRFLVGVPLYVFSGSK